MEIPAYYKNRLADMEGYVPGTDIPKLRLVFGGEDKHKHGTRQGFHKYVNPQTMEPMAFWILECWYPPEMLGPRDSWNYDFMGPYPADCKQDCCNGGYWGFRAVLSWCGEFRPLNEETLSMIEQKHFNDVKWSLMNEVSRLNFLNEQQEAAKLRASAESWEVHNEWADEYATKREQEDNADNRVFSFGGDNALVGKNAKMPIGSPKIII